MKFTSDQYNLSFSVPDRVTVRQQMAYYSEAARAMGADMFVRLWLAARTVIVDWTCPAIPSPDYDLDAETDPKIAAACVWAAIRVKEHMDRLDEVPKNS